MKRYIFFTLLVLLSSFNILAADNSDWTYYTKEWALVDMTPTGNYIAAGSWDNTIYLFDSNGKLLWNYVAPEMILSVSITPDGRYISAGSVDSIYLLKNDGTLLWKYPTKGYTRTAVTPDGKYIVAGSDGGILYLFDSNGKILIQKKIEEYYNIDSVSISRYGDYISTAGKKYSSVDFKGRDLIYYFDKKGNALWKYQSQYSSSPLDNNVQNRVAMTPDGGSIAVASDNQLYAFDKNGNLKLTYTSEYKMETVDISDYGNYITGASWDGNIYFFDTYRDKEKPIWKYKENTQMRCVDITPDGKYIASCSGAYSYIFDTAGNKLWQSKNPNYTTMWSISVSDDGSKVATGTHGYVHLFNTGNLKNPLNLKSVRYLISLGLIGLLGYFWYRGGEYRKPFELKVLTKYGILGQILRIIGAVLVLWSLAALSYLFISMTSISSSYFPIGTNYLYGNIAFLLGAIIASVGYLSKCIHRIINRNGVVEKLRHLRYFGDLSYFLAGILVIPNVFIALVNRNWGLQDGIWSFIFGVIFGIVFLGSLAAYLASRIQYVATKLLEKGRNKVLSDDDDITINSNNEDFKIQKNKSKPKKIKHKEIKSKIVVNETKDWTPCPNCGTRLNPAFDKCVACGREIERKK
ncbi:MAG: Outer membrane protein assembly factor BamB [Candidatus Methanofastidiosum methylothiophilum]|uniref:Outer membrane protein assembly factor BamB n=1 Tax=Candidatus Methanofastidiosum methylothiophilum TaxID=1705564 RepID=A0A150INV7_9EURY|nr:MAG: Outer membrane protein assembly factor BamB [Candidatus Methanofastidiosum methylthiophilus]KYC46721.1 MAG: Outer membrane protein assembly factor BamB [Candidatus Methanofastidiosum methylthiophilus]KYC49952.1 MAG: Outer membrane protein assembly factor BamB [Candidatus Methanofastidiosum methylthiophilus]